MVWQFWVHTSMGITWVHAYLSLSWEHVWARLLEAERRVEKNLELVDPWADPWSMCIRHSVVCHRCLWLFVTWHCAKASWYTKPVSWWSLLPVLLSTHMGSPSVPHTSRACSLLGPCAIVWICLECPLLTVSAQLFTSHPLRLSLNVTSSERTHLAVLSELRCNMTFSMFSIRAPCSFLP